VTLPGPLPVLALFVTGAALLIAAVRWWRPEVARRDALFYLALTAAFFAQPLFTRAIQAPTDIAYELLPWREALREPVAVRNRLLWDTLVEQVPFHTLVRQRLLAGQAPLWSHELTTGEPLLGNVQSAPFAPLHLLALPLPPLRALPVTAAWQMLLHLLLAHALALALGASPAGARLAGVAVGLSSHAVAWLYDTPGMSWAWAPGVLLGLLLLARRARGGFAGLVACSLGLALSGHPETLAHVALGAAAVMAVLAWRLPRRELGPFLLRTAAAAALAGALAAPVLLPFVEALPHSFRWAAMEGRPDPNSPPPFCASSLLPLIEPLHFGWPRDGNWSGPVNFSEVSAGYAGALALALALAGALLFRGRLLFLLAGGLVALAPALRLWPFFDLLSTLPLIGVAQQARLRGFWVLAVALTAGLALDRLITAPRRARAGAAALVLATGTALLFLPPPDARLERIWWAVALVGLAAAGSVLLVGRPGRAAASVALAAVTADLFVLGVPYHPSLPPRYDLSPPPSLRVVIDRSARASTPVRVLAGSYDLLPNLAAIYGLWDPRGTDPMRPADAYRLLRARLSPHRWSDQMVQAFPRLCDRRFCDFLAVRYLLAPHGRRYPPPWNLLYDGIGGAVWENPEALPLFFMPHRMALAASAQEVWEAISVTPDLGEVGFAVGPAGEPATQQGNVTAIRPRSNGFDLELTSPTGGTVVSSVSYDAGWRARLDGAPTPVFEVDSAFLGFQVSPGMHRVRLDYSPTSWTRGLLLASLGLLGIAAATLATALRRRSTRRWRSAQTHGTYGVSGAAARRLGAL